MLHSYAGSHSHWCMPLHAHTPLGAMVVRGEKTTTRCHAVPYVGQQWECERHARSGGVQGKPASRKETGCSLLSNVMSHSCWLAKLGYFRINFRRLLKIRLLPCPSHRLTISLRSSVPCCFVPSLFGSLQAKSHDSAVPNRWVQPSLPLLHSKPLN